MTKKNKHLLWSKDFPESTYYFSCYYFDGAAHDIADTDEGVIDIFIKDNGKNTLRKIATELKKLIDSDMNDKELSDFIHDKLGSAYVSAPGESRNWLKHIYDYIKEQGCLSDNLPFKKEDKHPLWDIPMYAVGNLFSYYYWELPAEIKPDEADNYKFIDWDDKNFIRDALKQITELIESDISDKELRDLAHEKINTPFFSDPKDTRIWLDHARQYISKHKSFSINAVNIKKNKHPLYDLPMAETRKFFSLYYGNKEAGKTLEDFLDTFIDWEGHGSVRGAMMQLTKIIDNDMEDQEIEAFMNDKIGFHFLDKTGDSRNWLIRIRDYLKSKVED